MKEVAVALQVLRDGAFPVRLPGSCNFFENFGCKLDLPETPKIIQVSQGPALLHWGLSTLTELCILLSTFRLLKPFKVGVKRYTCESG